MAEDQKDLYRSMDRRQLLATHIPGTAFEQSGIFCLRAILTLVILLLLTGPKPANADGPKNFLYRDAGITVFFPFEGPTNLQSNLLRNAFRTIQTSKPAYLIGSIPAPGYESAVEQDAKVLIHNSGWVVIYYLAEEPSAKIVDIEYQIKTRLDKIAEKVISVIDAPTGPFSYTHFQYPDADYILRVGRLRHNQAGINTFQMRMPGTNTYYERNWFIKTASNMNTGVFHLDGLPVATTKWFNYGVLKPEEMVTDAKHIIGIESKSTFYGIVFGEMVLVYSGTNDITIDYADWIHYIELDPIPEGLDSAASDVAVYYETFIPILIR